MYLVRKDHGVLSTPWGVWKEGEPFVPTPDLPKEKLKAWLEAGVLVTDESGPDVEELVTEEDMLTKLSRKELLALLAANRDTLSSIKPRTSWGTDVIRQAIRDIVPELSSLKPLPPEDNSSL